jgi:hypothetical protein|tara:strand:- start:2073 stop:2546 length:474 start_codon:yes stop_codon:yes gene_type:complete
MKIIDNFLPEEEFKQIQAALLSNNFPYYFNGFVADDWDNKNFYFNHNIYKDHRPRSEFFEALHNVYIKLNVRALFKVKVNCFPRTEKLIKYGEHKDTEFKHKGALFSINTCNGGTIIGEKFIPSIANRMLLFDSSKKHRSTNCTDEPCRVNINFNYF